MVTRVTNTMMKNTLLSNLSMNLSRMDRLQNQMSSGRKFGHISDDPSALIYGQAARNKMARLSHFQGAVNTAQSWLTQAEAGVMELQKVVGSIYEELVSAGSVKTPEDRQNLGKVVGQLKDHYVDTLNTAFGDRFIFGGFNTPGDWADGRDAVIKPFTIDESTGEPQLLFNGFNISQFDGMPSALLDINLSGLSASDARDLVTSTIENLRDLDGDLMFPGGVADFETAHGVTVNDITMLHQLLGDVKSLDVGPGITMPITMNGIDILFYTVRTENGPIVRNTFDMLQEVYDAINDEDSTTDELTELIRLVQDSQNHLLTRTAEIGGRQRRLELLEARYETDMLNYESMRSDAEDADMAEVIMYLKMAETVYQAALSAGARIIQPTLMDFLR